MTKNSNKAEIVFPNLILIPVISVVGMLLKAFGATSYDWLDVIFLYPVMIYMMFSFGMCLLAFGLCLILRIFSQKH